MKYEVYFNIHELYKAIVEADSIEEAKEKWVEGEYEDPKYIESTCDDVHDIEVYEI